LPGFSDFVFEAGLVARSIGDYFSGGALRLGVTGLSRSGKTVFLSALVNNLIAGARLPVFAASAEGRIIRARLEPQPDDAVPRFGYEEHLASLSGSDRRWPQSTRRIAELRLTIEFESAVGWGARSSSLKLDLVDYPGEWLLDLPLLDKSYAEWSRETVAASETPARAPLSEKWRQALVGLDPGARRRLRPLDPAARPVPHAGRSRGFAGFDVRSDRPRGRGADRPRLARGDDGSPLRGL
jgi:uncharacterized protein